MKSVDYDAVAPSYDRRYTTNYYEGTAAYLRRFVGDARDAAIAEVGCGTGHWLAELSDAGFRRVFGLDYSAGMLEKAHANPASLLVRGTAELLPWANASLDRVFCINALHHFQKRREFAAECRRVLEPGGGFLTIALDPHRGTDKWWVYDYFPAALDADLARYPSTATITDDLTAAGFREVKVEVAQHMPAERTFEEAEARGYFDRRWTSQLMVIGDDEYAAGLARLLDERPVLRADLRLYATTAWIT